MATGVQQNSQLYRRYVRNLALLYQKRQDVRAFVELLLTLSAITIFGLFAIRPTIVTIIELNSQIKGGQETIKLLDAKIQSLAEAQEAYTNNRAVLSLLGTAVPENPSPENYIRQVEGLTSRHSLLLLDLSTSDIPVLGAMSTEVIPDKTKEQEENLFPSQVKNYELEFAVSGDYEQIRAFLRDFEFMRRPMLEDTVSIGLSGGDLPGELVLSITGRLSYIPSE
jgi:hypothetical protein